MRHVLRLALLLCLATHTVFAAKPVPMDATNAGDGPQRLPSIPSSTYPYYQTIRTYSFDNAGVPNAQGWTTQDMTAQYGVFWHVDDFAGLSGYAPLQGTKSMWCGVRPGVVTDPAYENAPGFGDNWTQILRFPSITNPFGAGRAVTLGMTIRYDIPDSYDRMDVEYRSPAGSGSWNLLTSFTGTAAPSSPGFSFTPSAPTVEIRFVMISDGSASDESYGYDSNGAVVLDNIGVFDNVASSTLYFQNFESYPVGTTNGGSWVAETPAAFGNYAGVVSGSTVYQDGTPNTTGVWSFFNGSSATYACGGHPSQAAVPYTPSPGSTRPGDYLYNEIRSPWIDFTVDQNNQPTDATMGSLAMDFDVYHPHPDDGVLPGWSWRFMVSGVPQPWSGVSFLTSSPSWFGNSTIRFSGIVIPPGATQVQFALFASDGGFSGGTFCHSQAPLFDNVRILRLYNPVRVTNTNDSGIGSMRQAITNANALPDMNAMLFFLGNAGPYNINPASPLPTITGPLWIDGFSQTGSIANTSQGGSTTAQLKVALNGASAGANANGLWFGSGSSGVVRGLAIGGFSGAAIRYESTSLAVTGCYLGTDATGTATVPNGSYGIRAMTGGMDIGGPLNEERVLISATAGDAIDVMAGGCHILNAHLGYDANGSSFANGDGIHVYGGTGTLIGEPAPTPCAGEFTDRVWILAGNIVVEPAAQGVSIHQVRFDYGHIDLGNDGPGNANDPLDTDSGANGMQNHPVLTSADSNTIVGDMDGSPNQLHHIEFFSGDGYEDVTHYLGYQDVTTDGGGHASINFSCAPIPPGSIITATATAGLNTSELGPWVTSYNTAPGSPSPLVNLYDSQQQLRATVQYDYAFAQGNTFLNATTPPVLPNPGTWNVGGTPHYWDIATDVTYFGSVHVCVYYDPAQVPGPEGVLRLLHYEGGAWVDVTTSVDIVNNVICGAASSLSPFVIAKRTNATAVGDLPGVFALHANVPNPFNPTTTINYDVRRGGADVHIDIFDVSGRLVRTLVEEHRAAGRYSTQWNGLDDGGRPVASGVYFYRMQAAGFNETRKMVLLK
ncbi:MAG TPA: FlgD immunoglobulin-like domain containing protein [Candidatus Krumholzibacteria bacterium]|nr:FlgD immunoglobulin-like domain containing protein [Candidatus Krumholzibacteria bacterium]